MASLLQFVFTNGPDQAIDADGWFLGKGERAKAMAGNDSIIGRRDYGEGIENTGSIKGDAGDDEIYGETILTTNGNGLYNALGGLVDGGDGNDTIHGQSLANGINNDSGGIINGNRGNDVILGSGNTGILNTKTSEILGGSGNDAVRGLGGTTGILNNGLISTGSGNDRIQGRGSNAAIVNDGLINTGTGNDRVDGRSGGLAGAGSTQLGAGRDVLIGFGTGQFFGDAGKDTLLLPEGTYSIDAAQGVVLSGTSTMQVSSFELIGGTSGGLFPFATGSLSVNAKGVASFS